MQGSSVASKKGYCLSFLFLFQIFHLKWWRIATFPFRRNIISVRYKSQFLGFSCGASYMFSDPLCLPHNFQSLTHNFQFLAHDFQSLAHNFQSVVMISRLLDLTQRREVSTYNRNSINNDFLAQLHHIQRQPRNTLSMILTGHGQATDSHVFVPYGFHLNEDTAGKLLLGPNWKQNPKSYTSVLLRRKIK